jgi:hypothetical protein
VTGGDSGSKLVMKGSSVRVRASASSIHAGLRPPAVPPETLARTLRALSRFSTGLLPGRGRESPDVSRRLYVSQPETLWPILVAEWKGGLHAPPVERPLDPDIPGMEVAFAEEPWLGRQHLFCVHFQRPTQARGPGSIAPRRITPEGEDRLLSRHRIKEEEIELARWLWLLAAADHQKKGDCRGPKDAAHRWKKSSPAAQSVILTTQAAPATIPQPVPLASRPFPLPPASLSRASAIRSAAGRFG